MKLSNDTLTVLKNFATINPNIVVNAGSTLKTISEAKNILARAEVAESFPVDFGVYDLNAFLSVVGMFEEPELVFSDDAKSVQIVGEGGQSVTYFFSDASILTSPQKDITMPPTEITFSLAEAQIAQLRKASAALGVNEVVVKGEEGVEGMSVVVTDIKDATSNSFKLEVEGGVRPDESFEMVFNIANFKFVTGDMSVKISSKLISEFSTGDVAYWVALEKSSKYGV